MSSKNNLKKEKKKDERTDAAKDEADNKIIGKMLQEDVYETSNEESDENLNEIEPELENEDVEDNSNKINYEVENVISNEKEKVNQKKSITDDIDAKSKKEKTCFGPERLEEFLKNWFDSNKIFSLLVSLFVGILTHISFLSDMLLSQDGMWNSLGHIMPTTWELCLGRWGIIISDYLTNNLSVPNITGVISLVLVAIATLVIIDVLDLKSKFSVFMVSAAMMLSPSLTATLIYVYTSVAYCTALLIAVLSVKLMFTKRYRIISRIFSIIFVCLTLSIYQSYIGVIVGLALIGLISRIIKSEDSFKNILIRGIVCLAVIILGGLLYMYSTNVILEKMNLTMADYNGAANISISNSINNLSKTIPNAYNDFYKFYFTDDIVKNENFNRVLFWKILFGISIFLEICAIFVNKMWKKPWKILFLIIFTLLVPLGLSSIDLLVVDYSLYIVTSAQFMLIIALMTLFVEGTNSKFLFLFRFVSLLAMIIVLHTYFLADGASYSAMKMTYNQAVEVTNRILTRIEVAEEYTPDKPVMIAGYILDDSLEFSKRSDIYDYVLHDIFSSPVVHGSYYGMQGTWMKFINVYLGTRVVYCSTEDYVNIANSEEFKEMPIYPADGSVKSINGVMVVKLKEDPPMP